MMTCKAHPLGPRLAQQPLYGVLTKTTQSPLHKSRAQIVAVQAEKFSLGAVSGSNRGMVTGIDPRVPATQPSTSTASPVFLLIGGLGFVALAAMAFKKWASRGSLQGLEQRGHLGNRDRADPFLSDVMKDVNTVKIDSLSDDQIMQARARRSKEMANHKVSLEEIELPDNHPWATKATSTQVGAELAKQRLQARSSRNRGEGMEAAEDDRSRLRK